MSDQYAFGEFYVDPTELVLRHRNKVVPLTPKAAQLLALLVRNAGRVVSRNEIIEHLWPDSFVEESNLTVTISMVRKALGEWSGEKSFIQTISKRGYRFIEQVEKDSQDHINNQAFSGMEVLRITQNGRVLNVAVSADGRLLAYVLIETGTYSLWVRDLVTTECWRLLSPTRDLVWGPQFSPNGLSLFYIVTPPNSTISELFTIPVRHGDPSRVIVNIDSPVSFSPTGDRIAFVRRFPGQRKDSIMLANANGSRESELVARYHPNAFTLSAPSWSPDGKLVVIGASRQSDTQFSVLAIPLEGGPPFEFCDWRWKDVRAVGWSSEGNRVYCSAMAPHTQSLQIWSLSFPDGEARRVTNDPNNYEELSIARHSRTLVTMVIDAISDIWLLGTNGASTRITFGRTEGSNGLAAGPDFVVYASTQNQQSDLWRSNPDGTNTKQLTTQSGYLPSISADGRLVAYASVEGGAPHVWVMDSTGGNKRQLTDGEGESYPYISPDGNWVVYSPRGHSRNTLWKVSTSGGTPQQLTFDGIAIKPVVSPDGQKIACTYRANETARYKTVILSSRDGALLQCIDLPDAFHQIIRWSTDNSALHYLERENGTYNIWRYSLEVGDHIPITNFNEDTIFYYDWLSDNSLVVSRGRKTRDIVLIKNFN